jgi:biopolymer transport protein ExbB/TolQ
LSELGGAAGVREMVMVRVMVMVMVMAMVMVMVMVMAMVVVVVVVAAQTRALTECVKRHLEQHEADVKRVTRAKREVPAQLSSESRQRSETGQHDPANLL